MAKTFHLTIARIGKNVFDGEAVSATLPGVEGVFTVLADHEPFVSALTEGGEIRVTDAKGKDFRYTVPVPGVAEVSKNQATVLF